MHPGKILAAALLLPLASFAAEILGTKPSYVDAPPRSYPNQQAITPRIWVPGLEEGWIPQGLALVGGHALVSAYQEGDAEKPKCRVFRVELATGKTVGSFDMPPPCVHAGGITDIGGGFVILADTRQDWRIDLDKAFAAGTGAAAARGMIKLSRGFGSAFTFFDGKHLWNGVWVDEKDAAGSKIYRLDLAVFDRDGVTVDAEVPLEILPVPIRAQGGALDRQGNLWIASSLGPHYSKLYRVDRKTGQPLATYEMPSRIENIVFDKDNRLWALSESGARKYHNAKDPDFPFIFEIDVARLK
jgi:outer membrane protein assembly factor BamB